MTIGRPDGKSVERKLVDGLSHWSVSRSDGQAVDWSVGRLVSRSNRRSGGQPTGRSEDQTVSQSALQMVGRLVKSNDPHAWIMSTNVSSLPENE